MQPIRYGPDLPGPWGNTDSVKTQPVLVTYGWVRSSLAVMRNLARHGLEVYAGDHQDFFLSKVSRYVKGTMKYPGYRENPEGFIEALTRFIAERDIGTYLPSHEEGLVVARYRDRFPESVKIPLAPFAVLDRLHNKQATADLCAELNLPHPATVVFESQADYEVQKARLPMPGIFKQLYSHGSHGIGIYHDESERDAHWRRMTADLPAGAPLPLVQEYLAGKRIYAATLVAQEGHVAATFVRRNLREKEIFGGACVKCESVYAPELTRHAVRVAEHLRFTGVAMFEFLVEEAGGAHWLMEINPRYWGTSSHEIDCGVEYPWMQYCLLHGIPFQEHPPYRAGLKSRWIVGDVISWLKRRRATGGSGEIGRYLDWDDDFFMDLKWDDPLPFLAECYLYFKFRKQVLV